jgi:uncharacterized membrane protein
MRSETRFFLYLMLNRNLPCSLSLTSDQSTLGLSKGRLEALSDGIFATVMTVFVLSLSVPVIAGAATSSELSGDVNLGIYVFVLIFMVFQSALGSGE